MRILVAASEIVPYAKTGGLGDVLGALPKALAAHGHDVKVFVPHYRSLNIAPSRLRPLDVSLQVPVGTDNLPATLASTTDKKTGLEVVFVGNETLFDREGLYVDPDTGKDYEDNDKRFVFFARAVLEASKHLRFQPDIVHVHDWQAGLIPVYLATELASDSFFSRARTVLTIHNLAHQGTFEKESYPLVGLPEELFWATGPFEFYGKVNLLKAAIIYADKITTVSPRYAREIQTSRFGCGLEGILKQRAEDLTGILNGVDYSVWSPTRDKHIPGKYFLANLSGKRTCRVELLREAGLPIRDRTPLIGIVSRLVHQKGFDLFADAAEELFARDIQMVVLGSGEAKYEKLLKRLESEYPDRLKVYLGHSEKTAHWIEAGSDIFLMPSLFEPCGLNQMYSLKYGTVPIVNPVGGLADTVVDFDPDTGEGTGFHLDEETPEGLLEAVDRAVAAFSKKRLWTRIMKSGMRQDFSWDKSVAKYIELFEGLPVTRSDRTTV